jgi:hypothetical protein
MFLAGSRQSPAKMSQLDVKWETYDRVLVHLPKPRVHVAPRQTFSVSAAVTVLGFKALGVDLGLGLDSGKVEVLVLDLVLDLDWEQVLVLVLVLVGS